MFRLVIAALAVHLGLFLTSQDAGAQCLLENPSFEVPGSGSQVFAGWNQFGVTGTSGNAVHGSIAAKLTGPNLGGWDVSGYWQPQSTAPGEKWEASVKAWHTTTNPLTGSSAAILNIEWRDGGGGLISFESHNVVTSATPVDMVQEFFVISGAAPAGAVTVRFLLGVLQEPGQPTPDVYYDIPEFYKTGPPSMDEMQWDDFPGGRTMNFSGRTWRVKGPGWYGPGPNLFDDGVGSTWVDGDGRLHMTIRNIGGSWYSTEVVLEEALGYGDYIFTTYGEVDNIQDNVVLGLFIWQYGPCWDPAKLWYNPYNEIDVEFSRWGTPGNDIGQFVCQPWDGGANTNRFDYSFSPGELTSHAFRWLEDRVEYRSWIGGPLNEHPSNMIHSWTYAGPHLPRPEQPRVHINLWQFNNAAPTTQQEIVLDRFTFVPPGGVVSVPEDRPVFETYALLKAAVPNPFSSATRIGWALQSPAPVEVDIFDAAGRLVRRLAYGAYAVGDHEVTWDGLTEYGTQAPSGVYFYQLRSGRAVETKQVTLVR